MALLCILSLHFLSLVFLQKYWVLIYEAKCSCTMYLIKNEITYQNIHFYHCMYHMEIIINSLALKNKQSRSRCFGPKSKLMKKINDEEKVLTLSRPLDVNYVLEQGQGHGHLSKYLIWLDFSFFSCLYEKKTSKSSLKNRSLDISLQHKNRASNKFSKKNFCTWPKMGLALKGLKAMNNCVTHKIIILY